MGVYQVYLERGKNVGPTLGSLSVLRPSAVRLFTVERVPNQGVPGGISRIYLDGREEIMWLFSAGGSSPQVPLRVSEHVDRQLEAAGALAFNADPWNLVFIEPGKAPVVVSNLWFTERRRSIGPDKVLYFLADRRYAMRSVMVDTIFNRMRSVNKFNRPTGPTVDPNVAKFAQVPKQHFVPYTCRTGKDFLKNSFSDALNDNYEPWTALSALLWMLDDEGFGRYYGEVTDMDGFPFVFGPTVVSPRVVDHKILLKNWNPRGTWADAVNELSRMARVQVFVDQEGRFNVTSLQPLNSAFQGFGAYSGAGGIPFLAQLNRTAPRSTTVHFPEWLETRWDYDADFAESFAVQNPQLLDPTLLQGQQKVFYLDNVVRMPQDTVNYVKGQYLGMMKALQEWREDPFISSHYQLSASFTEARARALFQIANARKFLLSGTLGAIWMRDPDRPNFRSPILEARVAAMYNGFHRMFRFPEVWLDHILDWRAESSAIFATASRTRQPSPVWCDYHSWDRALYKGKGAAATQEMGRGYLRNQAIDGDPNKPDEFSVRDVLAPSPSLSITREPAPCSISIDAKDQGVFTLQFPPDLSGVSTKYGPGLVAFDRIPPITIYAINPGESSFKSDMELLASFRMYTLISILWSSPNSPSRFYRIRKDGTTMGISNACGPESDLFFSSFDAYRSWSDDKVSFEFSSPGGGLRIDHQGQLENEAALKEIAQGVLENAYFEYNPLIVGTFRAQGWTNSLPDGHVSETAILFNDGVFETELRGEQPQRPPSLWEFLGPDTREILARFEKGTTQ